MKQEMININAGLVAEPTFSSFEKEGNLRSEVIQQDWKRKKKMRRNKLWNFSHRAVNVLKILVMAVGAGLGAWGVINLMEGYDNDNPGAKSQGIKQFKAK